MYSKKLSIEYYYHQVVFLNWRHLFSLLLYMYYSYSITHQKYYEKLSVCCTIKYINFHYFLMSIVSSFVFIVTNMLQVLNYNFYMRIEHKTCLLLLYKKQKRAPIMFLNDLKLSPTGSHS